MPFPLFFSHPSCSPLPVHVRRLGSEGGWSVLHGVLFLSRACSCSGFLPKQQRNSTAWKSNLMAFLAAAFLCACFPTPQTVLRAREVTAVGGAPGSFPCNYCMAGRLCQFTTGAMATTRPSSSSTSMEPSKPETPLQDTRLQLKKQAARHRLLLLHPGTLSFPESLVKLPVC